MPMSMSRRIRLVTTVLATALWLPTASAAQSPPDRPLETRVTARSLFDDGLRAAQLARWSEAREAFERSYALVPRPITLLNLAGALVQSNRMLEGAEAYRRFLREAEGDPAARHRAAAEAALADVESRIPTLRIRLDGSTAGDRVLLDGRAIEAASLQSPIALDPGRHVVSVVRGGSAVRSASVDVAERERASVVLDVRAREAPRSGEIGDGPSMPARGEGRGEGQLRRPRPRTRSSPSMLESPWLWTIVGAVVIGGSVAVGIVATQPSREPTSGDIPPFRQGL